MELCPKPNLSTVTHRARVRNHQIHIAQQNPLNIWFLQIDDFCGEKERKVPKQKGKKKTSVLGKSIVPLKIYFRRKNYLRYLQITKSVLKYVWHIFNAFLTAGDMLEKFFELILNITLSLCDSLSEVRSNLFLKR